MTTANTASALKELKPSKMASALEEMIVLQQPTSLWGPPGIGKSAIVRQAADRLYAAEYGYTVDPDGRIRDQQDRYTKRCPWFRDVRAINLDPTDLKGLPHVNGDGRAHWALPDFLPTCGSGVFFLDELTRAPSLVQNACLELALDRTIGDYDLPDGWSVVTANNRETDGGGVGRMHQALANRFVHYNLVHDTDDWVSWAIDAGIDHRVWAFMKWRPELLMQFSKNEHSFPTPRSWEFVSRLMSRPQPDHDIFEASIEGAVGHGAMIEFLAFLDLFPYLVSVDAILMDPLGVKIPPPDKVSEMWATTSALSKRIDDDNVVRAIAYLDRLPRQEYAFFALRGAGTRVPALHSNPDYAKWLHAHRNVL